MKRDTFPWENEQNLASGEEEVWRMSQDEGVLLPFREQ